ncbi:MAG: hypothetical protein ABIP53_09340, partial [Candidatus Limnocylindrales bacterium]
HGFAINVDNDLEPFAWVVPCGLDGVSMTSVANEIEGEAVAAPAISGNIARRFATAFGRHPIGVPIEQLERALLVAG